MRYVCLILLGLLPLFGRAQGVDDLRLVQVQADVPTLNVWANLPSTKIEREQFSVSVGDHAAKVYDIDRFRQTGEGVGYVFLVDVSKSLRSRQLVQIKRALHHWLDDMRENDRAALVTFGHAVQHNLEFTNEYFKLNNAINMLAITDMETSLYHGLLEAISIGRSRAPDLPARRAIVVLSDGIDDSVSGVKLEDVVRQIREYRVPIYSIGFAAEPISDQKREGLKILSMLSRESGGYFVQGNVSRLDSAYLQQHKRITQAYRLRIDCPDCEEDGKLHHLNVTWSDGQRTLSDGFDMRLLPSHEFSHTRRHARHNDDGGWHILIFASGLVIFLIGLLWLYRHRLTWPTERGGEAVYYPSSSELPVQRTEAGLTVKLAVVTGIQKGTVHQLQIDDRAVLGRADTCELSLDDVEISAQHAMIQRVGSALTLRDLNSTNGTLVNGVPVHNEYPLRDGDLLLLGRTELRIEFADSAE